MTKVTIVTVNTSKTVIKNMTGSMKDEFGHMVAKAVSIGKKFGGKIIVIFPEYFFNEADFYVKQKVEKTASTSNSNNTNNAIGKNINNKDKEPEDRGFEDKATTKGGDEKKPTNSITLLDPEITQFPMAMDKDARKKVYETFKKVSLGYSDAVIIAGTAAYKRKKQRRDVSNTSKYGLKEPVMELVALNCSSVWLGGNLCREYYKKSDDDTANLGGHSFSTKKSSPFFAALGLNFYIEICKEAAEMNIRAANVSEYKPKTVDVHVIISDGASIRPSTLFARDGGIVVNVNLGSRSDVVYNKGQKDSRESIEKDVQADLVKEKEYSFARLRELEVKRISGNINKSTLSQSTGTSGGGGGGGGSSSSSGRSVSKPSNFEISDTNGGVLIQAFACEI